jgi:hypothetical protein
MSQSYYPAPQRIRAMPNPCRPASPASRPNGPPLRRRWGPSRCRTGTRVLNGAKAKGPLTTRCSTPRSAWLRQANAELQGIQFKRADMESQTAAAQRVVIAEHVPRIRPGVATVSSIVLLLRTVVRAGRPHEQAPGRDPPAEPAAVQAARRVSDELSPVLRSSRVRPSAPLGPRAQEASSESFAVKPPPTGKTTPWTWAASRLHGRTPQRRRCRVRRSSSMRVTAGRTRTPRSRGLRSR